MFSRGKVDLLMKEKKLVSQRVHSIFSTFRCKHCLFTTTNVLIMNYQYSQTYPVDNHEHYNQTSTNQLTQLFNETPSTPLSSADFISTVNNNNNNTSNPFPLPMDQNALLTQMYPQ
eukprot:107815_1